LIVTIYLRGSRKRLVSEDLKKHNACPDESANQPVNKNPGIFPDFSPDKFNRNLPGIYPAF